MISQTWSEREIFIQIIPFETIFLILINYLNFETLILSSGIQRLELDWNNKLNYCRKIILQ